MTPRDAVDALVEAIERTNARFVGLAGPPGAGKSTLAHRVADRLEQMLVLSLDDFYLSREDRAARGLPWRGPPGSYDLPALLDVLDRLRSGDRPVKLPRFSAEIDDRIEPVVVSETPRLVLVEGWVLGHREDGYGAVLDRLDLLVYLDVPDEIARARRFGREQSLRKRGGGFSDDEMHAFWDEVLEPGMRRWVRAARESADVLIEMGAG
ncbi:MAG TPA: hypothetical protein VFA34_11405 [Actinomycetota bacterium]|jgi:pantothenate kinase-related protein Tda10|nr:hypothetical protein [Actinomycetota bacterium]